MDTEVVKNATIIDMYTRIHFNIRIIATFILFLFLLSTSYVKANLPDTSDVSSVNNTPTPTPGGSVLDPTLSEEVEMNFIDRDAICDDIQFEHQFVCCEEGFAEIEDSYENNRIQIGEIEGLVDRINRLRDHCGALPPPPQIQDTAPLSGDDIFIPDAAQPQSPLINYQEPQAPPTPPAVNDGTFLYEPSTLAKSSPDNLQQAAVGESVRTSQVSGSLFSSTIQSFQNGWQILRNSFCSLFRRDCT